MYFNRGLKYGEIRELLERNHQVLLSQRQIKRHLHRLNLKRRLPESPTDNIITAIIKEVEGSGRSSGIRIIHQRLRLHHKLVVKRKTVRDVLDILMPGVLKERRRNRLSRRVYSSQGPNYLIHVDQYDKLAKYGFYIHGAIDGYSRKLLWLKLGSTNRKSSTVAGFFLEYASGIAGLPQLIRVDGGTENVLILKIQKILRENGRDRHARMPYFVGRSVHNQRIESFWAYLRGHFTSFWMLFFQGMMDFHLYDPNNPVHCQVLQFCFTELLRNEVEDIFFDWNNHRIRKMRNANCPSGVPEIIYNYPELFGSHECKQEVNIEVLNYATSILTEPLNQYGCSDSFAEICLELMDFHGYANMPSTWEEALELYNWLTYKISNILDDINF